MDGDRMIPELSGLAEKVAAAERKDRRLQRRYLVAILLGACVLFGALFYLVNEIGRGAPQPVVIDPAKLPPIRPGPPQ